jgi:hypothetical protein
MSIPDFDMYMSISMLDFGTYMSMLNEHTGFWYMYMSMLMSIPDFRMYMYKHRGKTSAHASTLPVVVLRT